MGVWDRGGGTVKESLWRYPSISRAVDVDGRAPPAVYCGACGALVDLCVCVCLRSMTAVCA